MLSGKRAAILPLTLAGTLVIVASAANAPLQRAERPTLYPKELWVYNWEERKTSVDGPEMAGRTFSGKYQQTLIARTRFRGQEAYVLQRDDGTFDVLTLDLWELARLYPDGEIGAVFELNADLQFPLYVGRVYRRQWRNPLGHYQATYTYTVDSVEEIETPAGRLPAFRISETGHGSYDVGGTFTEWGKSYFAPAAKRFVHYLIETSTGYRFFLQLKTYQVLP